MLKAIAKSPAERYNTAQELADDLRRFLGDQPIRARRPALLDRAVKWSRRHRGAVFSALVLLLLATVGLLVSTVLITRSHGQAQAAYEREREEAKKARQQQTRAETNLTQARQVLDFLTRVSVEELGDKPEFLHVRRKMLEGALQYYQQFIDQHHDDPSVRAELDASSAHVARILSALSAQQEYLQLMLRAMLLEEKAVQRDLGITPAQEEKIAELSERLTEQRHELFGGSLALSEQERGQKFKELAAANEKAVAALLDASQVKRLKQIAVQQLGPQAFVEPDVVKALNLTPDQKAGIRTALDDAQRILREELLAGARPAEIDRKFNEIAKSTGEQILTLLTSRQAATWQEMTGERFRGRIHFTTQSGFRPPVPPAGPEGGPPDFRPPPPEPPPEGPRGPRRGPPGDGVRPVRPERF